jgi:hypothetical protein
MEEMKKFKITEKLLILKYDQDQPLQLESNPNYGFRLFVWESFCICCIVIVIVAFWTDNRSGVSFCNDDDDDD